MLVVHPSGYYAWLRQPESARAIEDRRLLGLMKQSWVESGCIYGYRKIHDDLCDLGERCGKGRVERWAHQHDIKAQVGCKKHRGIKSGPPSVVAPNRLQQRFDAVAPDTAWVTDITYIRTHAGWLFSAVVLDLYSRQVIGWSMQSRMAADLTMRDSLMAVWRGQPITEVIVHSGQGSQYTGYEWQDFLRANNLVCSMSRCGNCHDNAVVEGFFQLLKRELVKRRIYRNRATARADIFNYIEMFYNRRRKHGYNDLLSPVEYENRHFMKLRGV